MFCPKCGQELKIAGKEYFCEECHLIWAIRKVGLLGTASQEIIDQYITTIHNYQRITA